MQKTTNYNLNQWESTDPIRREDFNADNAAIDAALNSLNTAAEEVNKKVAAAYSPENPLTECICITTENNSPGDILYTFEKSPRFVIVYGVWNSIVVMPSETCTMYDYHSHSVNHKMSLLLQGSSLQMIDREEPETGSTLRLIPIY